MKMREGRKRKRSMLFEFASLFDLPNLNLEQCGDNFSAWSSPACSSHTLFRPSRISTFSVKYLDTDTVLTIISIDHGGGAEEAAR